MPVYWADTDTIRGAGKSIRGRIADDAGSVSAKLRQLPLEWALPPDKRQSARVVDDVAESIPQAEERPRRPWGCPRG